MNDKITEIAEQAGFYVNNGVISLPTTSDVITEDIVKFATLIIRQCLSICDSIEDDYLDENDIDPMYIGIGAGICHDVISKTFGVEQ